MTIIVSRNGDKGISKEPTGFKDEKELEEYIISNPECIPLNEINRKEKIAILANQFRVDNNIFDILATDENGEIYIIETKLYKNPDKRKVTSQVLDYGTSLWNNYRHHENFDAFRSAIEENLDTNLLEHIKNKFSINESEEIIAKLKNNLSDGNFIFFVIMDELNDDLKNQIKFLNMKTDNTFAIYAIKMEKYLHDGYTIMVPKLFGFEAKEATSKSNISKQWDEISFFEEAANNLNTEGVQALQKLYDFSEKIADRIGWGSSFQVYFNKISPRRSLYYVYPDGRFVFNSHMLQDTPGAQRYSDEFKEKLSKIRGITIPDGYPESSPRFLIDVWSPVVDDFISAVKNLITA
jgi:hypothetical protein